MPTNPTPGYTIGQRLVWRNPATSTPELVTIHAVFPPEMEPPLEWTGGQWGYHVQPADGGLYRALASDLTLPAMGGIMRPAPREDAVMTFPISEAVQVDRGLAGGVLWCGHWSGSVTPGKAEWHWSMGRRPGPTEMAMCPDCRSPQPIREANVYQHERRAHEVVVAEPHQRCPDGGECISDCEVDGCWRVLNAEPLKNMFPGDVWPDSYVADAVRQKAPSPTPHDPLLGFAQHVRDTDPAKADEFDRTYVPPEVVEVEVTSVTPHWACERCGVDVTNVGRHQHWHREISLALWSLGSLVRTVVEA